MGLIEAIKEAFILEVRPNSQGSEYLEAVIQRMELDSLVSLLKAHFGRAVKEADVASDLPEEIEEFVNQLGGLRIEQSFYYKKERGCLTYAALWPWQSNPDKITLKCGVRELSSI